MTSIADHLKYLPKGSSSDQSLAKGLERKVYVFRLSWISEIASIAFTLFEVYFKANMQISDIKY